jgi:hypothetical protein
VLLFSKLVDWSLVTHGAGGRHLVRCSCWVYASAASKDWRWTARAGLKRWIVDCAPEAKRSEEAAERAVHQSL